MNYNYSYRREPVIEPAQLRAANDQYHPTIDQRVMLGCKLELADGRIFRYCRNSSAAALTKALMTQEAEATGNWTNESQSSGTAAAIGDKSITIAVSTAPTAHIWDDGYLFIQDGTGQYEMYIIKSHTLTGTPTITIADEGGIRVATVASGSTEISVVKSLYRDVVVHPVNTATGIPTGVPITTVPISYYFWAQRRGPCAVQVDTDETLTIGTPIGVPVTGGTDTAGVWGVRQTTLVEWGTIMHIGEADGTALVYLTLE